jgi:hypothetical protein
MRFIYIILLFLGLWGGVAAANPVEYVEPTFDRIIDLTFADGLIDLSNDLQFVDYIKLKDCNAYKANIDDDFKWQALKKEWQSKAEEKLDKINRHYKIPAVLKVDRYNFDTLAFDLDPQSRLQNVNYLEIFEAKDFGCDIPGVIGSIRKGISTNYQVQLEAPFSMLRVPMGQALGKRILEELPLDFNNKQRLIYLVTYVAVDAMDHVTTNIMGDKVAVGIGRIDKIEFYVDQERTRRFKTLYPSDD